MERETFSLTLRLIRKQKEPISNTNNNNKYNQKQPTTFQSKTKLKWNEQSRNLSKQLTKPKFAPQKLASLIEEEGENKVICI
jgi:hypothetical protein